MIGLVLEELSENDLKEIGLPWGPTFLVKRIHKKLHNSTPEGDKQDSEKSDHTKPSKKQQQKKKANRKLRKRKYPHLSNSDYILQQTRGREEQESVLTKAKSLDEVTNAEDEKQNTQQADSCVVCPLPSTSAMPAPSHRTLHSTT